MPKPLPSDYQALTGAEKLDLLWANVAADPYSDHGLPVQVPGPWGRRKLFSVEFNRVSFEHEADELPLARDKLVHRWGTTARAVINIDDDRGYTGVFRTGGRGLLRFSDAVGGGKFQPSLAFKVLVDGRPSVNLLALPAARRDPADGNALSGAYANATPPATAIDAKLVAWAFQKTADALGGKRLYAVYLPLHHLAGIEPDGNEVDEPKVPDRIELHPTAEALEAYDAGLEWRRALAGLPGDVRLFEVRAAAAIDEDARPVGEIRLESAFVASAYGDDRLFFQHDVGPR